MLSAIWYHLYNLKNVKPAILLKVTLLHGCFSRFLNCTNGTKSLNASQSGKEIAVQLFLFWKGFFKIKKKTSDGVMRKEGSFCYSLLYHSFMNIYVIRRAILIECLPLLAFGGTSSGSPEPSTFQVIALFTRWSRWLLCLLIWSNTLSEILGSLTVWTLLKCSDLIWNSSVFSSCPPIFN